MLERPTQRRTVSGSQYLDYIASNVRVTDEYRMGKDLEGNNSDIQEELSRKLPRLRKTILGSPINIELERIWKETVVI
jgi:hypothetical protein